MLFSECPGEGATSTNPLLGCCSQNVQKRALLQHLSARAKALKVYQLGVLFRLITLLIFVSVFRDKLGKSLEISRTFPEN